MNVYWIIIVKKKNESCEKDKYGECLSNNRKRLVTQTTSPKKNYQPCNDDNQCLSNFCSKITNVCKPKQCKSDSDCTDKYCSKQSGQSAYCEDFKTKFCNRHGECRSKNCLNGLCICRNQDDCASWETCTKDPDNYNYYCIDKY